MKSIAFILIYILTLGINSYGQTATIKINRVTYVDYYEDFDSIRFYFNGVRILTTDTIAKSIKLNKPFDQCIAIIGKDTLQYLTKFKPNEEYIITPGCCCAAFILKAKQNPRRGIVSFKNKYKHDLGLIIAEANLDTVKMNQTKTMFAHESAMCYFKPCSILLVETPYMSKKFDYTSDTVNYDSLWRIQYQYRLALTWFHFLHGEKIEIYYDEKVKSMKLKFKGYLTDAEYKEWSESGFE